MTNTYQCDFAQLAGILTPGMTRHLTLTCGRIFERTASRDGLRPGLTSRDKVSIEINYTGDDRITSPSGNWEVKKLTFKMTPDDPARIVSKGESLFSPQLGGDRQNPSDRRKRFSAIAKRNHH